MGSGRTVHRGVALGTGGVKHSHDNWRCKQGRVSTVVA